LIRTKFGSLRFGIRAIVWFGSKAAISALVVWVSLLGPPDRASAQTSVAGSVLQAQFGTTAKMPANTLWTGFNNAQTTLPTDSTSTFSVDIRAMAYVSAASVGTSCQIGISANGNLTPGDVSPWVTVPANSTIAIPLEWVTTASAGQRLVLTMQFTTGSAAGVTIQKWTSITAEILPVE
jgi:hypothetical protein